MPVIGGPGGRTKTLVVGRGQDQGLLFEPRRVLGSKGLGRVLTERGRGEGRQQTAELTIQAGTRPGRPPPPMERARPEPPPQPRQLTRATPRRPLRPAPPPLPVEGASLRAAAAEPSASPPTPCAAAIATVASSCGEATASGVQPAARRVLQVNPEQVLLLPPRPPLPQAREEEAAASPAQTRLLQLRPELLLLPPPPPPSSEGAPWRPQLHPVQPWQLHVKAEKQEPDPSLDPSVGPRRAVKAGPKASRAAKAGGPGPALDSPRGDEKGKLEEEEVMSYTAKGGEGKSLAAIREGVIKTEEPERLREDYRLGTEPASSGLIHGSKDVTLTQPSSAFGPHQQDLRIPLTLHTVPPGALIQFQGPPPSELIRLTKVPLTPVPIKMQSLLEPSVKIETKDVPLTVLPSDAGIRRQGNQSGFQTSSVAP